MTKARIYRPAKTAMQSGRARTKRWRLVFLPDQKLTIDPLMGWTGMPDTLREVELFFETREAAIAYATEHRLEFDIIEPHTREPIIKSYADNFKFKGLTKI